MKRSILSLVSVGSVMSPVGNLSFQKITVTENSRRLYYENGLKMLIPLVLGI